jgi:hypothetical protein
MAAPDPLSGTIEEFTATDWKECVANFRPSGPNSFSPESGEAALTGVVPAHKVRGAMRFLLGYNNTETVADKVYIQRTNPVYHPRYERMVCTSAAEEEFKPQSKTASLSTPHTLKTPAVAAVSAAKSLGFRTGYTHAHITARFQPIPWELAEDSIDREHEYQRNTWIDIEPRIEVLSLDGFKLIFAEGESNTPPVSNPKGKEYPAPFGQILVKPDVTMYWKSVPKRFLMPLGLPRNVLAALGKVNDDSFNGFAKGTLLLMGAKLTRTPWALALGTEDPWNYQVMLAFSYFKPPKGKSADTQIDTNHGHNNMPWRGLAVEGALTAGDTNAGKWFLATRTGGSGVASVDPRLIEEASFPTIFRQTT